MVLTFELHWTWLLANNNSLVWKGVLASCGHMWYTVLIHYWYNAKIYICKILLKTPRLIALSLRGVVSYEADKWWMELWLWSWKSSPDEIWLCLPRLLLCHCSEHNIFMVISWQMEPRMWNCMNSEECWFFHRNCSIATSDTLLTVLANLLTSIR